MENYRVRARDMDGDVIGFARTRPTKTRFSLRRGDSGFSILEMIIASAIMMVGIVSVVQLVLDTLATVIAQRELDQMLSQPLAVNAFTDTDGRVISLGGAGSPGAAVVPDDQGAEQIDFTAALPAAGFFISAYQDRNDPNFPNGATFELRWAVIPQMSGGRIISKRIMIGCRQTNANRPSLAVNLDSWVHK